MKLSFILLAEFLTALAVSAQFTNITPSAIPTAPPFTSKNSNTNGNISPAIASSSNANSISDEIITFATTAQVAVLTNFQSRVLSVTNFDGTNFSTVSSLITDVASWPHPLVSAIGQANCGPTILPNNGSPFGPDTWNPHTSTNSLNDMSYPVQLAINLLCSADTNAYSTGLNQFTNANGGTLTLGPGVFKFTNSVVFPVYNSAGKPNPCLKIVGSGSRTTRIDQYGDLPVFITATTNDGGALRLNFKMTDIWLNGINCGTNDFYSLLCISANSITLEDFALTSGGANTDGGRNGGVGASLQNTQLLNPNPSGVVAGIFHTHFDNGIYFRRGSVQGFGVGLVLNCDHWGMDDVHFSSIGTVYGNLNNYPANAYAPTNIFSIPCAILDLSWGDGVATHNHFFYDNICIARVASAINSPGGVASYYGVCQYINNEYESCDIFIAADDSGTNIISWGNQMNLNQPSIPSAVIANAGGIWVVKPAKSLTAFASLPHNSIPANMSVWTNTPTLSGSISVAADVTGYTSQWQTNLIIAPASTTVIESVNPALASGTAVNCFTVTNGKLAGAINFAGGNNVVFGDDSAFADLIQTNFSWTAWVKMPRVNDNETFLSFGDVTGSSELDLYVDLNSTLQFNNDRLQNGPINLGTVPEDNSWHHLVVTIAWAKSPAYATTQGWDINDIDATIVYYLDGSPISTNIADGSSEYPTFNLNYEYRLGQDNLGQNAQGTSGQNYSGYMDEVAIFDKALSAATISALYNSGLGTVLTTNTSGIVALWHMNDTLTTAKILANTPITGGSNTLFALSATNTLTITATGITNTTADTYLVSLITGNSLALKDNGGSQFLTPLLNAAFPFKPGWRLTGTSIAGQAVVISR